MIRKMIALLACLVLAMSLTTALAETAETEPAVEWATIQLNNGAYVVAPSDYMVLMPGMTEEQAAALGLGLTAEYIDQLLTAQNMLLDCIAPDINCEYLISITPYEFTDFASCTDILLETAIPSLKETLGASGVEILEHEILRWDNADGTKDAYIVMAQTQTDPASGAQTQRLHGYSVKGGYGINVILISYMTEVTDAQASMFGTVISNIILPE